MTKPILRNPDATDTDTVTHLRIVKEDQGDEWPWMLDAVDELCNYSECVRTFATHAECVAAIPDFIQELRDNHTIFLPRGEKQ